MEILFTIVIIALAALVFFYLYLMLTNKTDTYFLKKDKEDIDRHANNTPLPKPRICPVCKSRLGQKDSLFAEMYHKAKEGHKTKVFIHGCRYCYKPNEKNPLTDWDDIQEEDAGASDTSP